MSNKPITTLPSITPPLSGSEPIETVQGGVSKKCTAQQIADLAPVNPTVSSTGSASYPLVLLDDQNYIRFTSSSPVTLTVPANASVAFDVGDTISFEQAGTGTVTVSAAVGVTINSNGGSSVTNGQFAVATLIKTATNTWTLFGNLV